MSELVLTVYVLMWPAIVAVVMFVIGRAFIREWIQARREGRTLV